MIERFHLRDQILLNSGTGLLDTALLPDGRFETMLFPIKHGVVEYGCELDTMLSSTEDEAAAAHRAMQAKWTKK